MITSRWIPKQAARVMLEWGRRWRFVPSAGTVQGTAKIRAFWCATPEYSWTYETKAPHVTFDVMEDGEKYCRGIVIDLKELEASAARPASTSDTERAAELKGEGGKR